MAGARFDIHYYIKEIGMKINIVYWSGTGNTQMMADAIAEGAKGAGADVTVIPVSEADASAADADVVILGCPAMGAESLEDSEFEPFYESVKDKLSGKKVALFGSYDWGDGEWMRTWQADAEGAGAVMVADGLIVNNTPDDSGLGDCRALGEKAAS